MLNVYDVCRKFHESSELFVYCGHGSGEKLFDKGNKYVTLISILLINCILLD